MPRLFSLEEHNEKSDLKKKKRERNKTVCFQAVCMSRTHENKRILWKVSAHTKVKGYENWMASDKLKLKIFVIKMD